MKGKARLIGSVSGQAYSVSDVTAKAVGFCTLSSSRAVAFGMIGGNGGRTRDTGLLRWLRVTPSEPQQLVWLVPQYGIDYTIETSNNLDWQIK